MTIRLQPPVVPQYPRSTPNYLDPPRCTVARRIKSSSFHLLSATADCCRTIAINSPNSLSDRPRTRCPSSAVLTNRITRCQGLAFCSQLVSTFMMQLTVK
ncbi:hypothetical protein NP493_410g03022 [Ridgeia piscesae]|uniref:Uncharacterized protein n=1 Tax=Ridgeia piscesae TaxID=27915 RepID=A0AAD9NST5_RIDPI|nr:hypothetical protein NP493_410g03022 [Ridgeia piscesae]